MSPAPWKQLRAHLDSQMQTYFEFRTQPRVLMVTEKAQPCTSESHFGRCVCRSCHFWITSAPAVHQSLCPWIVENLEVTVSSPLLLGSLNERLQLSAGAKRKNRNQNSWIELSETSPAGGTFCCQVAQVDSSKCLQVYKWKGPRTRRPHRFINMWLHFRKSLP